MEKLLKLDPEMLAQLLSSLDSQTVLLALAGASPQFMKRFSSMLEPEDAKVLDQRIKRIGSVNLRDIDAAQLRMVQSFDAKMSAKQPNKLAQQKRAA
jgi:flagellar motor switch protein FliG